MRYYNDFFKNIIKQYSNTRHIFLNKLIHARNIIKKFFIKFIILYREFYFAIDFLLFITQIFISNKTFFK